MLDRLHLELLHLLPDGSLRENSYLNIGPKSRSSIVTSVFGGTLQSEVRKWKNYLFCAFSPNAGGGYCIKHFFFSSYMFIYSYSETV